MILSMIKKRMAEKGFAETEYDDPDNMAIYERTIKSVKRVRPANSSIQILHQNSTKTYSKLVGFTVADCRLIVRYDTTYVFTDEGYSDGLIGKRVYDFRSPTFNLDEILRLATSWIVADNYP